MKASLLAGVGVAAVVAAAIAFSGPPNPATAYAPGPQQLAVLTDTKDYGYPGAAFTSPNTLVVYLRPDGFRLPMLRACEFGQRAGLPTLEVQAFDSRARTTRLGDVRCVAPSRQ